jgi:hypothetical protein
MASEFATDCWFRMRDSVLLISFRSSALINRQSQPNEFSGLADLGIGKIAYTEDNIRRPL